MKKVFFLTGLCLCVLICSFIIMYIKGLSADFCIDNADKTFVTNYFKEFDDSRSKQIGGDDDWLFVHSGMSVSEYLQMKTSPQNYGLITINVNIKNRGIFSIYAFDSTPEKLAEGIWLIKDSPSWENIKIVGPFCSETLRYCLIMKDINDYDNKLKGLSFNMNGEKYLFSQNPEKNDASKDASIIVYYAGDVG